jgi:hypothetical protein
LLRKPSQFAQLNPLYHTVQGNHEDVEALAGPNPRDQAVHMLDNMGKGTISVSAYDTAWLARLPEPESSVPLFPKVNAAISKYCCFVVPNTAASLCWIVIACHRFDDWKHDQHRGLNVNPFEICGPHRANDRSDTNELTTINRAS